MPPREPTLLPRPETSREGAAPVPPPKPGGGGTFAATVSGEFGIPTDCDGSSGPGTLISSLRSTLYCVGTSISLPTSVTVRSGSGSDSSIFVGSSSLAA